METWVIAWFCGICCIGVGGVAVVWLLIGWYLMAKQEYDE